MPTLFFFPWVAADEPVALGLVELVPYERGLKPGSLDGIALTDIDAVLANYGVPAYYPSKRAAESVTQATLLRWPDDAAAAELTEQEVRDRLDMALKIVFGALSARHFGLHTGYCNTEAYTVIAQRFTNGRAGDTAVTTRRRDGYTQQFLGDRAHEPRFVRPLHVTGFVKLNLDQALVTALFEVTDPDLRERLDAAIELYVLANTDSPQMPERTELVLMRAAFETLLEADHRTVHLVERFAEHFKGALPATPIWQPGPFDAKAWRARWPRNVARPMDAWVQDFCAARNAAAHGSGSKASPLWSPHNHLLFACWLFPLVVKGILAEEEHYTMTDEDTALRQGFEVFFAHDLLAPVTPGQPEIQWHKVERSLLFPIWTKRIH